MADEQIKIRIQADAEQFKVVSAAVEKALADIGKQADITAGKIKSTGAALKSTNQQWTNLALVVQDLPFGFRGIQNNLPALMGGFAALSGPIYLAGSAIIAFFTAWDNGLFSTKKNLKETKDASDALYNSFSEEATRVNSLISVLKSETETRERKNRAIKELQDINPDVFKGLKLEGDGVKDLNTYYETYINNLKSAILLKQYESQLNEIIKKELKDEKTLRKVDPKPLKDVNDLLNQNKNIVAATENVTGKLDGRNQNILKGLNQENQLQKQKLDLVAKISSITGGVKLKPNNGPKDKSGEKARKAQEKEIARQMAADEYLRNWEIKLNTDIANAQVAEGDRLAKNKEKTDNIVAENRKNIAKALYNINTGFLDEELTAIKTKTDLELKLNKNRRDTNIKSLEDERTALQALADSGTYTGEQLNKINEALARNAAKLEVYKEVWKSVAANINNSIQTLLVDSFTALGETLGELLSGKKVNIINKFGLLLADSLIGVGKLLIQYATMVGIATALFSDPLTWPIALGVGIAAVAVGSLLKAKLSKPQEFANGGIISGPTMGLMGEYPGARNNPEVVAPLDKLKSLIGDGGVGTLETRVSGSDLLIIMNKAKQNNNVTF